MIIFPNGIKITEAEYKCILHIEEDPESWLINTFKDKAKSRRSALIKEWLQKLLDDPSVIDIPKVDSDIIEMIITHKDFLYRSQCDTLFGDLPYLHNTDKFNGKIRKGIPRDINNANIVLFASGIDISEADVACLLAYIQNLEDWVLGAILGHINRGKKKMINQYLNTLLTDSSILSIPGDQDQLINMITSHITYETLPIQLVNRMKDRSKNKSEEILIEE